MDEKSLLERVNLLNEIGIALSSEKDPGKLLEKILKGAKLLTRADGATIYLIKNDRLAFATVLTSSLGLDFSVTSGKAVPFKDIPLYLEKGEPNEKQIVSYSALHNKTVAISDAYLEKGFDFSGPRRFDEKMGYRTKSVLAVPMKNHEGEVIGVLQLINTTDPSSNVIKPFSEEDIHLAESLASQAAIAMTNQRLIADLKRLFESLIKVIADAIDAKSPATANHARRVPILAEMIGKAVNETEVGSLGGVKFTDDELYELKIAAFLHDCGKITTPEYLIAKPTKLQGLIEGFELIHLKFELLKKELKVAVLEGRIREDEYRKRIDSLLLDEKFLKGCNYGDDPITDEMKARIEKIGTYTVELGGKRVPLLTPTEIATLSVRTGTLTPEERKIVQNHVVLTLRMLQGLPFPKNLKAVPEIAASHHERVDGKGYPRGLTKEQMSLQARILAVADVFEALSAPDRAYKEVYPLSKIYGLMQNAAQNGHLDPEIVEVFMAKKVGLEYGKKYLIPEQIDIEVPLQV